MKYTKNVLLRAHHYGSYNRGDIWNSLLCGCFGCLETFEDSAIKHWVDDGETALCPKCGIDSVLPDYTEYWDLPVRDPEFLKDMQEFWFAFSPESKKQLARKVPIKKPTRVIGVPIFKK